MTLIVAQDISVKASWGHIYGPVSFQIRQGGVTILSGRGGRGRTALLLTLAGRMKPTSGHLSAFGVTDAARHLFDQAAIANIDEVDGIEQTISVRDVVTEQLRWTAPWYRWVRQAHQEDLERICAPVFGPYPLPPIDAYVEELPELTTTLFRIAVANIHQPPLLVVGGTDKLARVENTFSLIDRLVALGANQTIITADINAVTPENGVREVIPVHNLTDDEFVGLDTADRT